MKPTTMLPSTWIWTRRGFGQDGVLYAARDTRWAPNVPDLVGVGVADVVRQAFEYAEAQAATEQERQAVRVAYSYVILQNCG